jgi:hypothetical protein
MDNSNLGDRILARRSATVDDGADALDEYGAYACVRGIKDRCLMIDFRFLNGKREAFAYSMLEQVTFEPSEGMMLRFLGVKVLVRGRNFAVLSSNGVSLLEAIHRHRVPWLREVEEFRGKTQAKDTVVVMKIEITREEK